MEYCSDFNYDLKVGKVKEKELGDLLSKKTIEVKRDLQAHKTGNIFIEYESRGKKSGISTSIADYYCIALIDSMVLIKTSKLKEKCRTYIGTGRDILGGDNDTSKGILLPITDLL